MIYIDKNNREIVVMIHIYNSEQKIKMEILNLELELMNFSLEMKDNI